MQQLERHSWWVLMVAAVTSFLFGVVDLLGGAPDNARAVTGKTNAELAAQSPDAFRLAELGVRAGGIHLMVIGVVLAAILLFGFRQNLRWAWWTMWSAPIMAAALAVLHLTSVASGQTPAVPVYSGSLFSVLTAAALLVSAPRFFRRPEG
jgi:hypothetical protein